MGNSKIAFYIRLKNIREKIETANFDNGNPGIGGTQYLFLLTVKYLNKIYKNDYALLLTDSSINFTDNDICVKSVGNEDDAIQFCEKNGINNLVFNANMADKFEEVLRKTKIRIILWAHNTLNGKRQRIASKNRSIYRIVCVSDSQYNNMKDTCCFDKCTFINNVFTKEFYDNSVLTDYSEKKVIYIGSLMPQKGVDKLIEIWRHVEKKEPDAQLYIFGGSNIWDPKVKVSTIGADKYYGRIIEKKMSKLIHPENVHFMGAKGWSDINKLITTVRVGVVNPSLYKRDETFCLSAIEMESHGIPIVSRKRNDGLKTTILDNKTGFLERNNKEIANKIVFLLKDKKECTKYGKNAREYVKQFIINNEIHKWEEIINSTSNGIVNRKKKLLSNDEKMLINDFYQKIKFIIKSKKVFKIINKNNK